MNKVLKCFSIKLMNICQMQQIVKPSCCRRRVISSKFTLQGLPGYPKWKVQIPDGKGAEVICLFRFHSTHECYGGTLQL